MEELLEIVNEMSNNATKGITLLLAFMFFDFLTGLYSAVKEGETITSRKMRSGIFDKFKWLIACGFGLVVQLITDYGAITSMAVAMGCTVELLSICENFKKVGIIFNFDKIGGNENDSE